jgi:hypothetical protein
MSDFNSYEFVVEQANEGKHRLARMGMVALYVLYCIAWLVAGLITKLIPLLALVPITLWIIVYFTWRYVSVEFEYSIMSGELTFSKIFGGRSRRQVMKMRVRDASLIAPLDGDVYSAKATEYQPEKEFSAVSSMSAPDIYFMLFELEDEKTGKKHRAIFYFEATAGALKCCRFYNQAATVVTKVSR